MTPAILNVVYPTEHRLHGSQTAPNLLTRGTPILFLEKDGSPPQYGLFLRHMDTDPRDPAVCLVLLVASDVPTPAFLSDVYVDLTHPAGRDRALRWVVRELCPQSHYDPTTPPLLEQHNRVWFLHAYRNKPLASFQPRRSIWTMHSWVCPRYYIPELENAKTTCGVIKHICMWVSMHGPSSTFRGVA